VPTYSGTDGSNPAPSSGESSKTPKLMIDCILVAIALGTTPRQKSVLSTGLLTWFQSTDGQR